MALSFTSCNSGEIEEEIPVYKGPSRAEIIDYYKGVCLSLQGSENHFEEILQAKESGANIVTIMVDYGLDDNGRPTVHEL